MQYSCVFFIIFLLNSINCNQNKTHDLLSVIVIFRHGDRTLLFPYPKDPYKDEKYWPEGLCQLTEIGKQQCFDLGRWLRKRYNYFLPPEYHMKDIHFRSTNRDRTLMSGGYLAAGLYHTNKNRPWTVVPIHTKPILDDNLLLMRSRCPRYDYLKRQVFQSSPFAEIHEENKKFFSFLSEQTGKIVETIDDVLTVYDTLKIENKRNLKLPKWTHGIFPEPMRTLSVMSAASEVNNRDMARLRPGLLLNWILQHFEHVTDEKPLGFLRDFKDIDYHSQKFIVFCGHDHVIVNILQTFGLFNMKWPYVSSALIFEYRGNENGEKYVHFFYKNSSNEMAQLSLKNCPASCPFDRFKKEVEPFAVNEEIWAKECQFS